MAGKAVEVEVEGRPLQLSNLDKVLYPAVGFTKGQVIDYYTRIAPVLLPHLRDRPLTLKRYPNGVDGQVLLREAVPVAPARLGADGAGPRPASARSTSALGDDLPTLVWLANLADLELHTSLSLAEDIERPDDVRVRPRPGPPAAIVECAEVALLLRELFDGSASRAFAEDVGLEGDAALRPAQHAASTYDDTKPFAQGVAQLLEKRAPGPRRVEHEEGAAQGQGARRLEPERRAQDDGLRLLAARAGAPDRLDAAHLGRGREARQVARSDASCSTPDDVLERVDEHGDLFEPVAELKQKLPKL